MLEQPDPTNILSRMGKSLTKKVIDLALDERTSRLRAIGSSPLFFRFLKPVFKKSSTEFWILSRIMKPGGIVFEVGANTGGDVILFANLVGSHGRIHAFEPVPKSFMELSKKVTTSSLRKRVILNNLAVSDSNGYVTINVPGNDLTEAALVHHHYASWSTKSITSFKCKVETLDDYARNHDIERIDFVGVDTEGAELLVLRGMKRILCNPDPPTLLLELFPEWMKDFGYQIDDIFSMLEGFGYRGYFIGEGRVVRCYDPEHARRLIHFPDSVNFLWVRKDQHTRFLELLKG